MPQEGPTARRNHRRGEPCSHRPDRERRIIHIRFVDELTQAQIGEHLGVSQMHVSHLLKGTLAKLCEGMLTANWPGHDVDRAVAHHLGGGVCRNTGGAPALARSRVSPGGGGVQGGLRAPWSFPRWARHPALWCVRCGESAPRTS
jgi:hypothetical protein